MKYSYNWLKWYIPEAPDADKLAEVLTYHLAEVENLEKLANGDSVFDIKILPNRAHDLLSHQGLAREIASLLNLNFVDPTPKYKIPPLRQVFAGQALKIEILTDKCRRYMGRIIRNVKVGPSPAWVVAHLEAIGERSINNLVDASNIVMFDCGQPTHVFDLKKIKEKVLVRQAKEGEQMTTLDDVARSLKSSDMVIADAEKILAMAGVKGGKIDLVSDSTTDVILEVANFDPTSVRKTAQSQNLFTESRKRYENDLSPTLGDFAMMELSALIAEMCPNAVFEDIVDVYPEKTEARTLLFRGDKVRSVLGLEVSDKEIEDILSRYNFEFKNEDGNFTLGVPPMRPDLTLEEDMAEEIGRVLGYDKVKGSIAKVDFQPKQNETYAKILWARNKLLGEGYSEVMTTSFRDQGKISVLASASDKNFLRANLAEGLKESLKLNKNNLPLLGAKEVKIFEIGTVWNPHEVMNVGHNDKEKIIEQNLDEFCKGMSPEEKNSLTLLQPSAGTFRLHNSSLPGEKFKMWPLYPFIARDIAVWVPEGVASEDVAKIIKENGGNMVIRGPELFDEFKKPASPAGGDGKVSYAFRIVFQSYDKTLTDAEVNEIMNKVSEKLKEKGWQVR